MKFRNKKVLVLGLGLLGGGVATANWLIKQGAKVTISDLKSAGELKTSLEKLVCKPNLRLGQQSKKDIDDHEVIVVNPGISYKNELVQYAIAQGKIVTNEAVIFYKQWPGKIISITGTRGKTTTATWTAHLMGKRAILAGNSPDHPFLKIINQKSSIKNHPWAVTEVSSFHLEFFNDTVRPPDIALLTNIYQDHLNRYTSTEEYAETKKNLYRWQKPGQKLITEKDATSENVKLNLAGFEKMWGTHNLTNVRMAALAAHLAGASWDEIHKRIATLPQVSFRQEVVYHRHGLTIINDTAATSPEGTIAAVKRFGGPATVLITGGTDQKLNFTKWGKIIGNYIMPEHMVMLEGNATVKMLKALKKPLTVHGTLQECLKAALARKPKVILFSPASKSFEKFKNEYDRGEQFNKDIQTLMRSHGKSRNSL